MPTPCCVRFRLPKFAYIHNFYSLDWAKWIDKMIGNWGLHQEFHHEQKLKYRLKSIYPIVTFQKVNHSWTVNKFSHCYQKYLENFVDLTHEKEKYTWSIKIYPPR